VRTTIPFWRDIRVIAILLQIVFAVLVLGGLFVLYTNMMNGLRQANLLPSLSFLSQPAGFAISESVIPYDPGNSYWVAFQVGVLNTVRLALAGVVIATLLGILLGIARLSTNWLLRNVAVGYIETIRNIPLLLQLFFWFFLSKAFPRVQESVSFFGLIFLNNRGVTVAWPAASSSFAAYVPWLIGAAVAGAAYYGWRRVQLRRRDVPGLVLPYALLIVLAVTALGWLAVTLTSGQSPLFLEIPEANRFNLTGGLTVTTSFFAMLTGLVIYTAAFIAEIVRSGIQAVNKGQREAARALGLSTGQSLRLVIFPQALRIMIPPMTSQYLNLTKNTSLAIAVGYPDLFSVARTTLNQTGQTVTVILIVMACYLSVSLLTSLIMNWYNKRIQLVER
jgi:general L-amino acid transport system permease protein